MESMDDYRKLLKKEAAAALQLNGRCHFSDVIGNMLCITIGETEINATVVSVESFYNQWTPSKASAYPVDSFFVKLHTDHCESGNCLRLRLICYRTDGKMCRDIQAKLALSDNSEPDWYLVGVSMKKSPSTRIDDEWHDLAVEDK